MASQSEMAAETGADAPVAAPSQQTLAQYDASSRSESQEVARRWKRRRVDTLSDEAAAAAALCKVRALARPCSCWQHFAFK